MDRVILLTHFPEYHAQAKAIQRSLSKGQTSPAALRQALEELAELAVKTLAEINDAFEGLAAIVIALHPEVKRASPEPLGMGREAQETRGKHGRS